MDPDTEQSTVQQKRKKQFNRMLSIIGILACAGLLYLYWNIDFKQIYEQVQIQYIQEPVSQEPEIDTEVPSVPDILQDQKPAVTPQAPKKLNYMFGMSFGETLSVASESELKKTLDDITSLGVGWIRVDMAWNSIQPVSKDTFVWGSFDRIVSEAHERGIVVLPILTYTPPWARDESCDVSKCPPAHPEEFAEFARTAVLRYAPQGVHVWEVWNEPNLRKFWASGADYARYTELLRLTFQAIHEADKNAVVLSGGLAPIDTGGGNITAREFLEGMYEFGAKSYFDAVAFHPYSFPLGPEDVERTNAWSHMADTEWNLRAIMQDNGDAHKKIWITEYGAPTGGPGNIASNNIHAPWSIPDHVTEAYQTELLVQTVQAQRAQVWMGPLFWYSYQDLGTNETTTENFFGIIRYDGSQKPAYYVLKHLLTEQN